jgi:hypothetical protein
VWGLPALIARSIWWQMLAFLRYTTGGREREEEVRKGEDLAV